MKTSPRFKGLSRLWWVPLVTGLIALGLGIWTLCSPLISLEVMAYAFAACMIAAGVLNLVYAIFTSGVASNWGWAMAMGILELIAGVWLFSIPAPLLTMAFVFVVGIWILAVIINSICEMCMMSGYSRDWIAWLLGILLITLVLALVFMSGPFMGGVAVWLYLGLTLILFGIYRIILAFKIRRVNKITSGMI